MEFAIPTLFVIPPGNIYPAAGSTDSLTGTNFGIFDNKYSATTPATIATKPYIYFAQNRKVNIPGLGTKRSEKIFKNNIIEWYKVQSKNTATNQITEVSDIHGKCEDDLSITLRLFSNYIEGAFANGLTRSFTIKAPCCGCEEAPCTDVDGEKLIDQFVSAINADSLISKFLIATKTGIGTTSKLILTGKPLNKYGNPCNIISFPYEYDRLRFDVFTYKGADTTQDFITFNRCDVFAKVTVTTTSGYPTGSGDEVFQLEKRYFSYQTTHKSIYICTDFNGHFERETISGIYYTTYYLKVKDPSDRAFELSEAMNESIIIAIPFGEELNFESLIIPFLGAPQPISVT